MSPETPFRLSILAILVLTISISIYHRRKADQADRSFGFEQESKGALRFRSIVALAGYLSLFAYLIYPPVMSWAQLDIPASYRWAGIAVAAAMIPLIYWMFSSLGKNVSPTVAIRETHQLVVHGPYRWIRHPLYTFATISFLGISLAAANWFTALMMILGFFALNMRTPLEEAKLIERFGDEYREYIKRTGRYLPKLIK